MRVDAEPAGGAGPEPRRVHTLDDLSRELELLRARAARGSAKTRISLTELARLVDIPRSTIHSYMTGKFLPPLDILDRIVAALGATAAELRSWGEAWFRAVADLDARRHTKPPAPVPRQLPTNTPHFTGREKQHAELHALLDRAAPAPPPAAVITGTAGVGKTALAVHWAHEVVHRFPDGQLYLNLRGFDPGGSVMSPAEAVRTLLDGLEVPPARIPHGFDAQVALYRSMLADKRALVVLDNARDADQVRPLLPGGPHCLVLVTSRHQLTSLVATYGAHRIVVDLLSVAEARELLARRLGADRTTAEPEAVDEIITGCARLPLALAIAAARATAHPEFPLAALAGELRDAPSQLDALDTGDLTASVRTVFSCSYHALTAEAANLFGLLGRAPGPDIGLPTAAALAALPAGRTLTLLRGLESVHLIEEHTPGRYRMHDLVRRYAAEQSGVEPEPLRRLVDYYLHTAQAATRLLAPRRPPIKIDSTSAGWHPHRLDDETAALAWFDAEHRCLLAAQHLAVQQGWHTAVWQLAWVLDTFHHRRGHLHNHLATWQAALAAAERLSEPTTHALAHRHLGNAFSRADKLFDALDHLRQALTFAEQAGDLIGQADAHYRLGPVWTRLGDDKQALTHATHSLRLTQKLGDPVNEARKLNAVGWMYARLEHFEKAREHCEQALTLHRRHHDREGAAVTLDSLGYIAHHTDRHNQALTYYTKALSLFRDLGNTYEEADTLRRLGETLRALGRHDDARNAWQHAIELYQAQHRTEDVERIRQHLTRSRKS